MLTRTQRQGLRLYSQRGRNRLGAAIALTGVTQTDIEAATGLSQSYVSRIKRGAYVDLPGETMRALAVYFGCTIEDLFPARKAGGR